MQDVEKYKNSLIENEHDFILSTYKRLPIAVDKAVGCRVIDVNGDEYLDFLAGIAVNALGHSHPRIINAVQEQIFRYMHVSNYFYQDTQIKLAQKLCEMSGFSKVFFTNSGTEATEAAIKLIRRWGLKHNKTNILAFSGGFHGRTYGALSIMDKPRYKDTMGPFLPNTQVIPLNDIETLMSSVHSDTAGVVLEFIQGEGGISMPTPEFIEMLMELKSVHNFLLVADEVQCGIGRSGRFFAFEHWNIRPDVVIMAKGLGGGLPLGGILVDEHLSDIWESGMHGTTYGGNAVACATGMVVLEELESGLMEHVQSMGEYFRQELDKIQASNPQKVLQVRGLGLMCGLLLSFDAGLLVNALMERKAIANAASGSVLRMVPPLIIGKSEIDEFVSILQYSLDSIDI
ncbi:MAG: aspartate aminotransferase family protein [Ignavibacteriae bacterium HGW-Ignavibacteriae-1]|jgi:predicted acetylornithine/succinylornithine family transaminase|nr:MAG: aspartate aminotransferase family protein [Ignavibacteriae bacterium HGW-Ignavibacteriae-1]